MKNKNKVAFAHEESEVRALAESGKYEIIVPSSANNKKNRLKSLESGLTPIIAKCAARTKTSIGFDIEAIRLKSKEDKAQTLAGMRQNIKITRKAKTCLALKARTKEAKFLLLSLGASTKQAAETAAQSF